MEPALSNDSAGDAMSPAHAALWQRIRNHPFECADDGVDFLTKLIREQGWTREHAHAAIDEYRRYCFLAVTAGRDMVPSDAVDQVWHLHLTYTRDYWTVFCPTVLGCELHHEPSRARPGDAQRFADSYADRSPRMQKRSVRRLKPSGQARANVSAGRRGCSASTANDTS